MKTPVGIVRYRRRVSAHRIVRAESPSEAIERAAAGLLVLDRAPFGIDALIESTRMHRARSARHRGGDSWWVVTDIDLAILAPSAEIANACARVAVCVLASALAYDQLRPAVQVLQLRRIGRDAARGVIGG